MPPHLSPFVNNEEEGYAPDFAQEIARLQVRRVLVLQAVHKRLHLSCVYMLLYAPDSALERLQVKRA
jgi:hypothetical protein